MIRPHFVATRAIAIDAPPHAVCVAHLFITKTVWATILALAVGVTLLPYPFLPRHLTIIDTLAIGIPSFFLALAPNSRRYRPGFVGRVLRFAIPAGSIVAAATYAAYALTRARSLPLVQQRTAATLVTLTLSLCVLVLLATPLTWRRIVLVGTVLTAFALLFRYPRSAASTGRSDHTARSQPCCWPPPPASLRSHVSGSSTTGIAANRPVCPRLTVATGRDPGADRGQVQQRRPGVHDRPLRDVDSGRRG